MSISIIILNNNHEPFSNLTKFSYLTNYPFNIKALKIVGNGNAEISFKKYGKYDCHLTLYNVNLSSVGKRVHSIYCEKQINQIISFSIWGEKTGEDIEYWNQQKDIYNLNNGWNKIKISNTGII